MSSGGSEAVPPTADSAPATAGGGGGGGDGKGLSKKERRANKQQQGPPSGVKIPPKKAPLTKAERRALQEQQRAAKQQGDGKKPGGGGGGGGGESKASLGGKQPSQAQAQGGGKAQGKNEGDSKKSPAAEEKKEESSAALSGAVDSTPLSMFSHLQPYRDPRQWEEDYGGLEWGGGTSHLHPEVVRVGWQYATGELRDANERCRAMLRAFSVALQDFESVEEDYRKEIYRRVLRPSFQFWTTACRPHSVSMGNAFTFVKAAVANLNKDLPLDHGRSGEAAATAGAGEAGKDKDDFCDAVAEDKKEDEEEEQESAREILLDTLDAYVRERIIFAGTAITKHACTKVKNGDVILTYGRSEVVESLLLSAASSGCCFRVVIVDARPALEGRLLLQNLACHGVECTYVLLNALSYVMASEVTKVFLGAEALMSDGSVFGPVGTAAVALLAKSRHIPVLVCCETYKISHRVYLESITGNELGPEEAVVTGGGAGNVGRGEAEDNATPTPTMKRGRRRRMGAAIDRGMEDEEEGDVVYGEAGDGTTEKMQQEHLRFLHLRFDLTPSTHVSGIVTEMGILPPTSVAVLLRELYNPGDEMETTTATTTSARGGASANVDDE